MRKTRVTLKGIGAGIQFVRKRDYSNTRGPNFSKVEALRTANPCATLQEIGDQVGLSRERVRQILHRGSQPTAHFRQKYICATCSKEFLPKAGYSKTFCSKQCFYDWHHIQLVCDTCGKLFRRNLNDFMHAIKNPANTYGGIYCSRKCFAWRPDNPRAKLNWPQVLKEVEPLLKRGVSISELARIYKVSGGAFSRHLHLAGIPSAYRHAPLTEGLVPEVARLRNTGLTWREIATGLRISASALARFIKVYGLSNGRIIHQKPHIRHFRKQSTLRVKAHWLCHLNFTEPEVRQITGCGKSLYNKARYGRKSRANTIQPMEKPQ